MNIKERAKLFLKIKGYPFNDFGKIIRFEANGFNFLLTHNSEDESFFKIVALFSKKGNFDGLSDLELLLKANKLNRERKVVKAIVEEEDIQLTTEILLDKSPEIEDIMDRMIVMICQAVLSFSID